MARAERHSRDAIEPETATGHDRATHGPARQHAIQPGKYSIERMLALEEYTRTKSIGHVLAVLFLTPLLPFAVVVAFEMPPLQPVEAGWQANWVFLVWRLGGAMAIVSEGGLMISRHIMPELNAVLHARVRLFIALVSALTFIIPTAIIADLWGFPVPFTTLLANPTGGSGFFTAFFFFVRHIAQANEETKRRLLYFCGYLSTVPVMATVYPAYIALFESVHRSYQPFVTLLIPVIKGVFRQVITRITAEWEDFVPMSLIFSIELFNSLYLVICVQSGGSALTTVAVMAIDLFHTGRSVWKLNKATRKLQQLIRDTHENALLPRVCALCEDSASLKETSPELQLVRVKSSLKNWCGLSDNGHSRLQSIEKMGVFSSGKLIQQQPVTSNKKFLSFTKVLPGGESSKSQSTDAIVEAASMLFRSEYLLLGEYLECIIPWIFATNLVVLWVSPNGAFYPYTREITSSYALGATLLNIGALLALEILTLVILSVVLWKRLKFSPLHQLSFVLENQAVVIQTQLAVLLVMSLQFNLDHVGADFSFQFKWLH